MPTLLHFYSKHKVNCWIFSLQKTCPTKYMVPNVIKGILVQRWGTYWSWDHRGNRRKSVGTLTILHK
jgi:hypothetical protein